MASWLKRAWNASPAGFAWNVIKNVPSPMAVATAPVTGRTPIQQQRAYNDGWKNILTGKVGKGSNPSLQGAWDRTTTQTSTFVEPLKPAFEGTKLLAAAVIVGVLAWQK